MAKIIGKSRKNEFLYILAKIDYPLKSHNERLLTIARIYSLVPKERHVRKESNGSTLGLYVVLKESHDSTLIKELTPKESHDCSFSLT